MSNVDNDGSKDIESEVKKAAEQAIPNAIDKNVDQEGTTGAANLTEDEKTPFIDEKLRTDD